MLAHGVICYRYLEVFKMNLRGDLNRFPPQTNIWAALLQGCKEETHSQSNRAATSQLLSLDTWSN